MHQNSYLLPDSWSDKAQQHAAKRASEPESCFTQACRKWGCVPDIRGEDNDPSTNGDFDTCVDEKEKGAYPSDSIA